MTQISLLSIKFYLMISLNISGIWDYFFTSLAGCMLVAIGGYKSMAWLLGQNSNTWLPGLKP